MFNNKNFYIKRVKFFLLLVISFFALFFLANLFSQNFPIDLSSLFKSNAKKLIPTKSAVGFQETLREIAKERTPAVVNIKGIIELDPKVANYYNLPIEYPVTGTGFIISTDGYIITNEHVIKDTKTIIITLSDRTEYYAGVIGVDEKTDVALLKIRPENDSLPTIPLGNSDEIMIGDIVIAIGNPWGLSGSMSMGIVSATGRTDQVIEESAILKNYIQTDVAINQGNSGGPLLNLKGEVVAVNSALITTSGGWEGVTFSIPINVVKRIVKDIADDGKVEWGYLGVVYRLLDDDMASYFNLDGNQGVLIEDVIENSPADEAGIKIGDIILEFNGEPINTLEELLNQVLATPINKKVPVKIFRNGKELTLYVIIKKKPEDYGKVSKLEISDAGTVFWLSMELGNYEMYADLIPYDGDGLVVVSIDKNSYAYEKGILPGDVIVSINSKTIEDIMDLEQFIDIEKGIPVLLRIFREGKYFYIAVKGE